MGVKEEKLESVEESVLEGEDKNIDRQVNKAAWFVGTFECV